MFGWRRYLSIEDDFLRARYYVSFDVEEAHSDFLSKSVILLGTEIEHAFKKLCWLMDETKAPGKICEYKEIILTTLPGIGNLSSTLREDNEVEFFPFRDWDKKRLSWWDIYSKIKHSSVDEEATMKIALTMLSAYQLLLILIEAYQPQDDEKHIVYTQLELPRVLTPRMHFHTSIFRDRYDGLFCWGFNTFEVMEKLKNLQE